MRILILANNDIGLYKFRKEIIEEFILNGHSVYISVPDGPFISCLKELGSIFVNTKIDRRGINPEIKPDYVFVIGLSQLIDKRILDIPTKGCVGFHPTPLPKFRGRAAMVWQVLLGVHETKCTLFMLDEGMDSGDILGQQEYFIEDTDYAKDVERKLCEALRLLSRQVLIGLKDGTLHPQKQNEEETTYLLIRRPEDGQIDWKEPIEKVHRLVRAVSHPYPGAFGMYDGVHQITIWRAEIVEKKNIIGIPGQICRIGENSFDVLGSDGILRVTEWDNIDCVKLFVGHKLK